MFNDIGNTLKSIAKLFCIIGIIASFILSVAMCKINDALFLIGLATFLIGALLSWVFSAFLYGFGQLVDNSDKLVKKIAPECVDNEDFAKFEVVSAESADECEDLKNTIKELDDSELVGRVVSSDYTTEYRNMCIEELNKRNNRL